MPDLNSLREYDMPLPTPYNAAYPHPISAYASPGVNQAALGVSGYDKILAHLLRNDPDKLKGTILAGAEREDILPPALTMILYPGEGNGIPERLWTRFESIGAARLQVGAANIAPYARVEPASGSLAYQPSEAGLRAPVLGPRFAASQKQNWVGSEVHDERERSNFHTLRPARWPTNPSDVGDFPHEVHPETRLGYRRLQSSLHEAPWYKREICPVWEDTGLCKNDKHCQVRRRVATVNIHS
jgi:hypothetical protein